MALTLWISLPLISTYSSAFEVPSCNQQWKNWQNKFSAPTPFASFNKTSKWKIPQDQLLQVINLNSVVNLPGSFFLSDKKISQIDVSALAQAKSLTIRDSSILSNVSTLVRERRNDELLIIFSGKIHNLDFYLNHPDENVYYANYPFNDLTETESKESSRFFQLLGETPKQSTLLKNVFAGIYAGIFARLYYYLKRGYHYTPDQLLKTTLIDSNVIFINDYHAIRDTSVTDELPGALCLKKLGFKSVVIALESFRANSSVTELEFLNKIDLGLALGSEKLNKIQKISIEAYSLAKSGKLILYPEMMGLLNKIRIYKNEKIPVRITGIE